MQSQTSSEIVIYKKRGEILFEAKTHTHSYLFLIRAFISPHYDLTSTLKSY